MRAFALLLLLATACTATPGPGDPGLPDAGTPVRKEWPPPATIGGQRPAKVIVPSSYDARHPVPALFLLGGYDYLSKDLDDWVEMSARVDRAGFILVMPDGTIDSDGSPFWNATDTCCDYDGTGIDDFGYLEGLRRELSQRFAIDERRVSLFGHSAGGFMAYRLACDAPEDWNAVASLAGSMWLDLGRCAPRKPVSILQIQGTDDDVMPMAGDDEAPGARSVVGRWAALDGCGSAFAEDATKRDYVDDVVPDDTTVERAPACPAGLGVELWVLEKSDHYPDVRPVFTDDVLLWLFAHPRTD